jgi:hypothetical protein
MREGNSKAVMPLTQERTYWKVSVYSSELRGIRLSRHHREIEEASALDRENHVHAPTGEFGTPGLARHVLEEKLVRFLIVQTLAKALQELEHERTEKEGTIEVPFRFFFLKLIHSLVHDSLMNNTMLFHVEPRSFVLVDRTDNVKFGIFGIFGFR